jgi:hypothetical protein
LAPFILSGEALLLGKADVMQTARELEADEDKERLKGGNRIAKRG